MVKAIQQGNKHKYQCEKCGLQYAEREIAEKCQAWCKEHKSCNLGIIKNAVEVAESQSAGKVKRK